MTTRFFILFFGITSIPFIGLSQSKWELKKNEDGIKIWTADTPKSSFKTFRAEMTVDADLEKVRTVLINLDTITFYYDGISSVTDVKQISENEAEYFLEFDFPWPVSKRRARVTSKVVPVEIGSYEISTMITPNSSFKEGFVTVKQMSSFWIIVNAGNNQTYIKHIAQMDPSGSVPAWIANSKVVDTPLKTLKNLRTLLENK